MVKQSKNWTQTLLNERSNTFNLAHNTFCSILFNFGWILIGVCVLKNSNRAWVSNKNWTTGHLLSIIWLLFYEQQQWNNPLNIKSLQIQYHEQITSVAIKHINYCVRIWLMFKNLMMLYNVLYKMALIHTWVASAVNCQEVLSVIGDGVLLCAITDNFEPFAVVILELKTIQKRKRCMERGELNDGWVWNKIKHKLKPTPIKITEQQFWFKFVLTE